MNTPFEKVEEDSVQTQRVAAGKPVWVQCEGYRCLAYLNHRGEWRALANNAKLTDVVRVLSDPPPATS